MSELASVRESVPYLEILFFFFFVNSIDTRLNPFSILRFFYTISAGPGVIASHHKDNCRFINVGRY